MLRTTESFAPEYKALMAMVPEDSLKLWTLLDLPVLPDWYNGKMALLGFVSLRRDWLKSTNVFAVMQRTLSSLTKLKVEHKL